MTMGGFQAAPASSDMADNGRKRPIRTVAPMRWNDASNEDNTRPCYSPIL
jgi:hypothetical protein